MALCWCYLAEVYSNPQSLVERLARLQTPNLNTQAIQYTRRVTQVWCGVFCLKYFAFNALYCI